MPNYDTVEAGILTEGMTPEQKMRFHREMTEAWRDPKKAARLKTWLGGIGAHHFYLGDIERGRKARLFFWTSIPAFMAMFEGDIKKRTEKVNSEIAARIAMRIKGEGGGPVREDAVQSGNVYSQLEKLADLKAKGVLSDEEFQAQKAKLLSGDHTSDVGTVMPSQPSGEATPAYQVVATDGAKPASGGSNIGKKILVYGGVVFGVGVVISMIGAVVGNKDQGGSSASAATPAAQQGAGAASAATANQPAPPQERALAEYAGRIPDREFFEQPEVMAALVKANANDSNVQPIYNREFEAFVRQANFLVAETVPNNELLEIIAIETNTKALTVALYRVINDQPTVSIGNSDQVRDVAALPTPVQEWVKKRSFGDQQPKVVFIGEADPPTPGPATSSEQR
jgi:hypothetical protein